MATMRDGHEQLDSCAMSEVDHPRLVRKVLEAASLPQPVEVERVKEGIGNHVYFAGDLVIRLGTGSDAAMFPRAVAVLRAAAATVAVPEVLFEDCSRSTFPIPVMVLARVPGLPLSRTWPTLTEDQRVKMMAAVATELDHLHRLAPDQVPGAGFSSPWWTHRVARIERLLAKLRSTQVFSSDWFDHMSRYFDSHRHTLVESPAACVLHGDVNWGNVLVAHGRITALLDFDDALAGPAEEDAWQLVFRNSETEVPVPLCRFRDLPGFDLSAPGTLERFRIGEIQNILDLLSGDLSWIEHDDALEDARETYRDAFLSDQHERLLDNLT